MVNYDGVSGCRELDRRHRGSAIVDTGLLVPWGRVGSSTSDVKDYRAEIARVKRTLFCEVSDAV
jgi:hypothetical protein